MTSSLGTIGTFTTDRALVVQTWDSWMVRATNVAEAAAVDRPIALLFPELAERGLLARLRKVADKGVVEVLSPALHKYLIPCTPSDPASTFDRMRQHIVISPIVDGTGLAGVSVTIEDVTTRFDHADRTVEISTGLGDDSWHLRQIATNKLANSSDPGVVLTLIDAVRNHHRNPALLNSALTALAKTHQEIVEDVVPLLRSDDTDLQVYAALLLGLIGDIRATEPLLAVVLDDTDPNVRFHGIEALGRIGDYRAAERLAMVANQRDFFLAFPALDALAAIGDGSIATTLLSLLEDDLLASSAVACLANIGMDDVVAPLIACIDRDASLAGGVATAISRIADRTSDESGNSSLVPSLVRRLMTAETATVILDALIGASDEDVRGLVTVTSWLTNEGVDAALAGQSDRPAVRRLATEYLVQRGVRAAPFVEAMTKTDDLEVCRAATAALGGIGSATSVPALVYLLARDPDPTLAITAITALGAIGSPDAFTTLLSFLDHSDAAVRQVAVAALNSIAHPQTESVVTALFTSPSSRLRECAVRIAGYFTYDSSLFHVIACCADADSTVRRAAVESLATFEDPTAYSAIDGTLRSEADPTVRAAAARALGHSSFNDAADSLQVGLSDSNLWVRYYAARACALVDRPSVSLVTTLTRLAATDSAAPVQVAAIETLASLRSPGLFALLCSACDNRDDDVSCAALRALGQIGIYESATLLGETLATGSDRQRHAALDALSALGAAPDGVIARLAYLADQTDTAAVSEHAVVALGAIAGVQPVETLLALGDRPSLRESVIRALATGRGGRLRDLEASVKSTTVSGKIIAISALGRMRDSNASRIIALLLNDTAPGISRFAAWTLARADRQHAG